MPQHPLPEAEHLRRKAAYTQAHRADPVRATIIAAAAVGISPITFRKWLAKQRSVPHSPEPAAPFLADPSNRPRYRVQAGKRTRVCYWTDTHVWPGDGLERIKWIARHIGETQPDRIRHGGDLATFDSVATHDPIGSIKAKAKPSLASDMEVMEQALDLFDKELGPSEIPRDFDCGNHEARVRKYEELRGELDGSLWWQVQERFAQYRWRFHDYGVINFCDGVGFVHIPQGQNGKPYSSPNIILRDLTHDLVIGHRHKAGHYPIPKIGGGVQLLDGGCSLPWGHVETYAKLNPTHWWWGITDIEIIDGKIADFRRVSMHTLREKYA
jgi:hypothetical protein